MLPADNRMRRSADFRSVMTSGRRARHGCLIVHHLLQSPRPDGTESDRAPIVGLVVGRTVGTSVTRHQVSRRLRAQLSDRLDTLAPASATVVRALPGAANAGSADLGRDLDAALRRLVRR